MSADEPFLARWSRRKLERDRDAAEETPPQPAATPAHDPEAEADSAPSIDPQAADRSASDANAVEQPQVEQPEVDLSHLPSLESIDAATDIRGFLARGVPAALSRAALRRAWAADPAIRDFIGLSENAWDFTVPDGVPGFGPLAPGTLPLSLADLSGKPAIADLPSTGGSDVSDSHAPGALTEPDGPTQEAVRTSSDHANVNPEEQAAPPPPERAKVDADHIADKSFEDVAMREPSIVHDADNDPDNITPRRRHGGALPG